MKPQIIVADDHRLVAEGIVKILEKEYSVAATPSDGRSFIEAVERVRPALALVDISLPLLNGLDACRHVKKSCPEVKIVILTMHAEPHYVNEAFRVGVGGYVLKTSLADELLFAVREVLNGRTYISPVVAQGLGDQALPAAAEPTPRSSVRVCRPPPTRRRSGSRREERRIRSVSPGSAPPAPPISPRTPPPRQAKLRRRW